MKKFMLMLLLSAVAQINAQCTKSGVTTYSTSQTVSSRNFLGDVVITNGATVTFTGTFTFKKDAFIRVEGGSTLIVQNSTLSAFCTDIQQEWWGIQVLGINRNYILGLLMKPSHLQVISSTIKNSQFGIVNSDNANFNLNNPKNCGIIHCDDVTFLDNLGDLKLIKPSTHSNLPTIPILPSGRSVMDYFVRCKFIRNGYYYNNSAKYFIDVYEGSFEIRYSSFEINPSGNPNLIRPYINIVDAFALVSENTFKKGSIGVKTSRVNKLMSTTVANCNFDKVFSAFNVQGTNFAKARSNNMLNQGAFNAIVHNSGTDFNYMHNNIESQNVNLGQFFNSGIGIWLTNVGKSNQSIAFNTFKNINQSIMSSGVHHNGNNSGLVIRCNKMTLSTVPPPNPKPGMTLGREIVVSETPVGQPLYGIKRDQASYNRVSGAIESANNTFTNNTRIFPNYDNANANKVHYYYNGSAIPSNITYPDRTRGSIDRIVTRPHQCSEFNVLKSSSGFLEKVERIDIKGKFDALRLDYVVDKAKLHTFYNVGNLSPEGAELETIVSLKKELLDELNRPLVVDALIRRKYTPDEITEDEVITTIRNAENENAEYLVADFYFEYGKYDEAIATLNDIENKFEINENDRLNIRDLTKFYSIMRGVLSEERDIYHMTDDEYNGMRSIAGSETLTTAKVRACNVLSAALEESCPYEAYAENSEAIDKATGSSSTSAVQVYPNPANDILNIKLGKTTADAIHLVDLVGRTLYSGVKLENQSEVSIPLRKYNIPNGAYRLIIWNGGKLIDSKNVNVMY